MQFFTVAAFATSAAAALVGTSVAPAADAVYTTVYTTAFTTYCPEATTFEFNSKTYTVTEATSVTITDCPDGACTVVKPIHSSTVVSCSGGDCGSGVTYPSTNGTVASQTVPAQAPASTATSAPACSGDDCSNDDDEFVSGAANVAALSGAALAGLLAVAAAL